MAQKREYLMQADANGVFEHILTYGFGSCNLRIHCDRSIKLNMSRQCYCPVTQVLTCKVCDEERKRWESWWNRVDAVERGDYGEIRV